MFLAFMFIWFAEVPVFENLLASPLRIVVKVLCYT